MTTRYMSYTDSTGKIVVPHLGPGVTPERAAQALQLAPGSWQEITAEEAAQLMRPTLDEARTAKIAEINTGYASVLGYIRAGYPPDEVQTWTMQAEQARELAENPEAQALFVRYLAAVKGVEADEMARRILVNAQNWEPVAGMLTAQRQLMEEAAWAATSVEEVEAIKVGYSV